MRRFFADLESRLAEAKGADERTRVRFFAELAPRLETARELDLELDRRLARRFNVFDYLRTDERGLSRIIADLLNPQAGHGQGTVFLRTLLEELKWFPLRHDLDECTISASVEHRTSSGRKIDVVVRVIAPNRQAWCLAIENKPFAGDQENQVSDYLEYLEEKFGERFLWNPNNKKPNILRRGLVQTLGRGTKPEDEYPWWDWLDDEKSCWSVLVRELHEECGMDNGGEITNYFVERFVEVATNTIPIIDELESTGT